MLNLCMCVICARAIICFLNQKMISLQWWNSWGKESVLPLAWGLVCTLQWVTASGHGLLKAWRVIHTSNWLLYCRMYFITHIGGKYSLNVRFHCIFHSPIDFITHISGKYSLNVRFHCIFHSPIDFITHIGGKYSLNVRFHCIFHSPIDFITHIGGKYSLSVRFHCIFHSAIDNCFILLRLVSVAHCKDQVETSAKK